MGSRLTTLGDVPPKPGGIVLVGINPALRSVEVGHYYQGAMGQRLWGRLCSAGLLDDEDHDWEDQAFEAAGNGLTDIVKRPSASAEGISSDEYAAGARRLARNLERWQPGLVLFAFRPPAERLVGRNVRPGVGPSLDGVPTFLMAGPYAASVAANANVKDLKRFVRKIKTN
jgi:TDG/mug DNA glycosylase family protein